MTDSRYGNIKPPPKQHRRFWTFKYAPRSAVSRLERVDRHGEKGGEKMKKKQEAARRRPRDVTSRATPSKIQQRGWGGPR